MLVPVRHAARGQRDDADDMVAAAQSSLGFWDNPFDDEDWNAG